MQLALHSKSSQQRNTQIANVTCSIIDFNLYSLAWIDIEVNMVSLSVSQPCKLGTQRDRYNA